jgi:hypothetical protein
MFSFRMLVSILGLVSIAGCECAQESTEPPVAAPADESRSAGGAAVEDTSHGPAIPLRDPGEGVPEPSRFEPIDPELADGATRARGWASIQDLRAGATARLSLGNWLCRLWTHYGAPPQVQHEGFVYAFRDRETDDVITAYSSGSGPAMGGRIHGEDGLPMPGAQQRVTASVDAFVAMIDATAPTDCALEIETDYGDTRVGVRGGEWFEESLP